MNIKKILSGLLIGLITVGIPLNYVSASETPRELYDLYNAAKQVEYNLRSGEFSKKDEITLLSEIGLIQDNLASQVIVWNKENKSSLDDNQEYEVLDLLEIVLNDARWNMLDLKRKTTKNNPLHTWSINMLKYFENMMNDNGINTAGDIV